MLPTSTVSIFIEECLESQEEFANNKIEVLFGHHMIKLFKRLTLMEKYKTAKPLFSQACDRLVEKLTYLA